MNGSVFILVYQYLLFLTWTRVNGRVIVKLNKFSTLDQSIQTGSSRVSGVDTTQQLTVVLVIIRALVNVNNFAKCDSLTMMFM